MPETPHATFFEGVPLDILRRVRSAAALLERVVTSTLRIGAWGVVLVFAIVLLTTAVVVTIAASTYLESTGIPLPVVALPLICAAIVGVSVFSRAYRRLRDLHEALAADESAPDSDDLER
jgi:TRAP-type C4-dicarboxylate transport system permease small subunit